MNNKKVIIVGPAHPYRGGIANFNDCLAKEYVRQGCSVQVYSFKLQYPDFFFPGKTQYEKSDPPKDIVIKSVINSINPFNWFAVANKIIKEKPDFLIVRYWLPFMAPCLGTICYLIKSKTKIIAITDNVIPHEKRFGDFILTKYFIGSCHAFITLSKSVLEDLSRFTKTNNKKFIAHPIYDTFGEIVKKEDAINKLNLSKENKYLLFFGFVRKYKGLDLMLEAIADPRVKKLDIKLIIAGEFYDDIKYYNDLISKFNISDNIIMRSDFIENSDVKNYFCACDMITQTYRTATQSGVTQIAYHFERPILVTDVGGLAEIVADKKGGYVTSKNPKHIADAILDFYANNREKEFSDFSAVEKKKYSWENLTIGIESLILS